jgi:hypothetical protein
VSSEFNGLAAPFAEGYFLGDYAGLAANSSGFIPFNVLTTCDDASCLALTSVTNPANLTPTNKNSTDVTWMNLHAKAKLGLAGRPAFGRFDRCRFVVEDATHELTRCWL